MRMILRKTPLKVYSNLKEEILLTFEVTLCTARWCNKTNSCVADSSSTAGSRLGQRSRLRAKSS